MWKGMQDRLPGRQSGQQVRPAGRSTACREKNARTTGFRAI